MELIEKLNLLEMPEEYAMGSFAQTIALIDIEEALTIKKYLAYYNVRLTNASELKYFNCSLEEIKIILARLQYLKDSQFEITDEIKDIVFDPFKWHKAFPNFIAQDIVIEVLDNGNIINPEIEKVLESDITGEITDMTYGSFIRLEAMLNHIIDIIPVNGDEYSRMLNDIIKILNSDLSFSDSDILFAVLVYGRNLSATEIEQIKNAVGEVMGTRREEPKTR